MLRQLSRLHPVILLLSLSCVMMVIPSVHALISEDMHVARTFFFGALLLGFLTLFAGIALAGNSGGANARTQLVALLAIFIFVPVVLALPFHQGVRATTFLNAYVEMVSSLTTTGLTLFDDPERLSPSLHLWRGLVGWLGGLIMWVAAAAVLAPMALGGFEILTGRVEHGIHRPGMNQIGGPADLPTRLRGYSAQLFPVYTGLTLVLWLFLILAGETPLPGFMHAMATMSTSAISPVGGLEAGQSGLLGEFIIGLFLLFAISRLTFAADVGSGRASRVVRDPEVRLAFIVITGTTAFIFLRHWVGAIEVAEALNLRDALVALWGAVFTVTSFLTTTGFESRAWSMAQGWSGLSTSGLILMGLALFGGGVATTAGGAKLLRVYALYRHGLREMERLVHPNAVGGSGGAARYFRRQGAYLAWLTFMLMTLAVAIFMLIFALTGESFEDALILTTAGLTTTGPLVTLAGEAPIDLAVLSPGAKLVLCTAMVMGRVELLAFVALFNPDFWRR